MAGEPTTSVEPEETTEDTTNQEQPQDDAA